MFRPGTALLRTVALLALLGTAACAEQRDLASISGVPDAPFGGGRGGASQQWGTMSTGGQSIVMHRESANQ
jgi:hypothetical protein